MSGEEAAGRDGAAMVARPRKRLVLEGARDRLGAERPPEEAARAQAREGVGTVLGARAHDGEAVRHRRPEARPAGERRGIEAGREAGHHRLGACEVLRVVRGADGTVFVVVGVGRPGHVAAVRERRQIAASAHHHIEPAPGRGRKVGELAAHAREPQARGGQEPPRVDRVREHDRGSLGEHAAVRAVRSPVAALALDPLDARALASIKAKTLILAGVGDLLNPEADAIECSKRIPGARLVMIAPDDPFGHASAAGTRPKDNALQNAEIARFLDSLAR